MRLIQLPALAGSGALAGARAGALAGALAAGALAGAFAGAFAAGALAACGLGAVVRAFVVGFGVGVEAELRTGAGTGFFFAGPLAAGAAGIGFFIGALVDISGGVVCDLLDNLGGIGIDVSFQRREIQNNVVQERRPRCEG